MTDNEIMKALGCCCVSECDECPYDEQTACVEILKEGTLALINRQKAEIERLQRQLQEGIDLSDTVLKIVKSEARKEFADLIKQSTTDKSLMSFWKKWRGKTMGEIKRDCRHFISESTQHGCNCLTQLLCKVKDKPCKFYDKDKKEEAGQNV